MTQHNPAVQELLDAAKGITQMLVENKLSAGTNFMRLQDAIEKLRPAPEMVKVLPDERPQWWTDFVFKIYETAKTEGIGGNTLDTYWHKLVTLTRQPKPREWWINITAQAKDSAGVAFLYSSKEAAEEANGNNNTAILVCEVKPSRVHRKPQ